MQAKLAFLANSEFRPCHQDIPKALQDPESELVADAKEKLLNILAEVIRTVAGSEDRILGTVVEVHGAVGTRFDGVARIVLVEHGLYAAEQTGRLESG